MQLKVSIAVLICTFNRKELLKKCLQSIKDQTFLPDHIVIIEKIDKKPFFNKKDLYRFFQKNLCITYKKIKKGTIAFSRNLAVHSAKEDIFLFVDDDVILEKEYIEKLLMLYKENPSVDAIAGKIRPFNIGYWQLFVHKLLTSCIKNENKKQKIDHWPTLNCSFRKRCFFDFSYDERFSALEDIDFCLQLQKRGYELWYFPQIEAYHLYRKSLREFYTTFTAYYRNNMLLLRKKYRTYNFDFPSWISISGKYNIASYVILCLLLFINSEKLRKQFKLPMQYYFACCVYYYIRYAIMIKM